MGIEARILLGEDRFCELGDKAAHPCLPHLPVLQVNSRSIDQKSGEIWTAQADLQPIHHKPDRLLALTMHCHLLIPGLFPPFRPETRNALRDLSLPALATLLARGSRKMLADEGMDAWLCRSFGVEKRHDWPVAALTLLADGGDPGGDFWLRAEPVHLQLQRDRLVLVDAGNLGITQEEANGLTVTLNEHFTDEGLSFFPTRPGHWHLRLTHPPTHLKTHSLETAIGRNIRDMLPGGPDGKRWHSLLNEIQMLLHRHPVNEAREGRGLLPVNSIWPWGGGVLPANLTPYFAHVWADNALAHGLAAATDTPCANVPKTATEWLPAAQAGPHHLVVLDALRAPALYGDVRLWRETLLHLEKDWLVPLRQALSCSKISRLTLTAFDSGQAKSFSVSRTDLWKIWLRAQPLESYLGDSGL